MLKLNKKVLKYFCNNFYKDINTIKYKHNINKNDEFFEPNFIKRRAKNQKSKLRYKEDFKKELLSPQKNIQQEQKIEYDELYGKNIPPNKVFERVLGKDLYYLHKKPNIKNEINRLNN